MQTVVVSLGGSVLLSKDSDAGFLIQLSQLIKKLSTRYNLFIITGGGRIARDYIHMGRQMGLPEDVLDSIGIDITRVNAKLLSHALGISNVQIPCTTDDAVKMKTNIVVMGGTTPGHSTDLVGAEIAEKTKAIRFVNATNVDGVYDKDPHTYTDAKKIQNISIQDLIKTYGTDWDSAGKHAVIDPPSLQIIKHAKIQTLIVNGKRLDQLENAITGISFDGTIIHE